MMMACIVQLASLAGATGADESLLRPCITLKSTMALFLLLLAEWSAD